MLIAKACPHATAHRRREMLIAKACPHTHTTADRRREREKQSKEREDKERDVKIERQRLVNVTPASRRAERREHKAVVSLAVVNPPSPPAHRRLGGGV